MPCNTRSSSSASSTSHNHRRCSRLTRRTLNQVPTEDPVNSPPADRLIQQPKHKTKAVVLANCSRGEVVNKAGRSSNSSEPLQPHSDRNRKRSIAGTDATDCIKFKKTHFRNHSSDQRSHNLRSLRSSRTFHTGSTTSFEDSDTASKSDVSKKQVNEVTPVPVRKLNFTGPKARKGPRKADSAELPVGVVNLYPVIIDYKAGRCCCPRHKNLLSSTDDNAPELSALHICQYGIENYNYLRAQELSENSQLLTMQPVGVRDLLSLSSLSSATVSPPVESDSDDEYRSDSDDDDDDDDYSNDSPRPGAQQSSVLRDYTGLPLLLHFSSLPQSEPIPTQPYITPKMRGVLVNWLSEVALEYVVSDDAYHLGISILDAVLAKGPVKKSRTFGDSDDDDYDYDSDKENMEPKYFLVHRTQFQVLGCACLWIAAKIQDKRPPVAEDLVYIADSCFTAKELLDIEGKICRVLEFRLLRVSPLQFLNHFLKASYACTSGTFCPFDHTILRYLTMYILELSRLSFELVANKPSLLAAASLYLARATLGIREKDPMHSVGKTGIWTRTLEHYTGYGLNDLEDTIRLIYKYQESAESCLPNALNATFGKFKRSQYRNVSLKTVPRFSGLDFDYCS